MSQYETLLYEASEGLGVLTLNRPQSLNAMNQQMISELTEFWAERRHDLDTRVIILDAAGEKGFCGGLDMRESAELSPRRDMALFYKFQVRFARIWLAMRQAPQPIIALPFGAAVGGGWSICLASDVRLAAPDTRFAAAYINIGMGGADMGASYFLPRLMGAGRAYEFLLTGDFMDAQTSLDLGLVSRVLPRDQQMAAAKDMAATMLRKNPLALRLTKEAINLNLDAPGLEHALNIEDRNQATIFATLRYEGLSRDTK